MEFLIDEIKCFKKPFSGDSINLPDHFLKIFYGFFKICLLFSEEIVAFL